MLPTHRPQLTHFLCIPLVTPLSRAQLQTTLSTFRSKVSQLRTSEIPDGISEKAIRPLGTLHLTLGVMSLVTPEKVEKALDVLRCLDLKGILAEVKAAGNPSKIKKSEGKKVGKELEKNEEGSPEPLHITLQGLHAMSSPSSTSILYASPIDPDLRLYRFCSRLKDIFTEAGVLIEENRPLLLHATIVNTVYVKGKSKGKGRKEKVVLDATGLVREYEEWTWMKDVKVERVAICRMVAKKVGEGDDVGEEYEVEGEVEMPV